VTREIREEARRQLAVTGASGLSLRAVARELGMASSALYRYFPSRDDLLTALILDAYSALADEVEQARAQRSADDDLGRWRAVCHAVRAWALAHPHEYALIYGSPVPGYTAPTATVAPASRISLALLHVVRDAWTAGRLKAPGDSPPPPALAAELDHLAGAADLADLPASVVVHTLAGLTQLFGWVSFELFGQFAGAFNDAGTVFAAVVDRLGEIVGLPPADG
jgi:AcrR family transcriptional regulator